MTVNCSLLVVNHVMDDSDPYLSHQSEIVRLLASNFSKITVITGRVGNHSTPSNVEVISTNWVPGHRIRNALSFLRIAIPIIFFGSHQTIFSHMADLQAAVISPFAKVTRKRHFLWYAHAHKSIYLSWASIWVTGIISSTKGSCPIQNNKVFLIGQSINPKIFPPRKPINLNLDQFIHVGRLDRSKNIDLLIRSIIEIKDLNPNVKLSLIGSTANTESSTYIAELQKTFHKEITNGTIAFFPSVSRETLAAEFNKYDIFIHGYTGSLDKTLIEATFSLMPVLTINPEYNEIFGTWSETTSPTLYQEYLALHKMSSFEIISRLQNKFNIALSSHSSDQWIHKLSAILASDSALNSDIRTGD